MNTNLLIVIGSLAGVGLGFILNELAGLIRQRREDKRLLRRALFGLLELHHFTSPVKIKQLSSMIYDWIQSKDTDSANNINTQELNEITRQIIVTSIAPIQKGAMDNISENYEKSVADIAEINPILAFSLSGRSRIQATLDQYLKSVSSLYQNKIQKNEMLTKEMLLATKEFYNKELSEALEDDLKKVAKQIGIFMRYRIYKLIKIKNKNIDPNIRQKLYEQLDNLLEMEQQKEAN